MNLPPPQQKQSRAERKTQARARDRADVPPPSQRPSQQAEERMVTQAQAKQEGMARAEASSTAGRNGELNLKVQWLDVWVGSDKACRFVVTTATGNTVEAVLEQKSYKKSYRGGATLQTDVVPIAPIGTSGSLLATDTTTGETLEQPWTWHSLGGGSSQRQSLWALIKKLLT